MQKVEKVDLRSDKTCKNSARKQCFESAGEKWVDSEWLMLVSYSIYCQGALEHPSATVKSTEWATCRTESAWHWTRWSFCFSVSRILIWVCVWSIGQHKKTIATHVGYLLMEGIFTNGRTYWQTCPSLKQHPNISAYLDRPFSYVLCWECVWLSSKAVLICFIFLLRCLFRVQQRAVSNVKLL